MPMRVFLDTEFIEYPGTLELISIALVTEDDRTFYAQSCCFDANLANPWVMAHVLPVLDTCPSGMSKAGHLGHRHTLAGGLEGRCAEGCPWFLPREMACEIRALVGDETPEFWGYYADYDWVVFCWLFGAMIDLPLGWPMYCRDLKQWCDALGTPDLPMMRQSIHHALADARANAAAWAFLHDYAQGSAPDLPRGHRA
jgi:hypothetical protein